MVRKIVLFEVLIALDNRSTEKLFAPKGKACQEQGLVEGEILHRATFGTEPLAIVQCLVDHDNFVVDQPHPMIRRFPVGASYSSDGKDFTQSLQIAIQPVHPMLYLPSREGPGSGWTTAITSLLSLVVRISGRCVLTGNAVRAPRVRTSRLAAWAPTAPAAIRASNTVVLMPISFLI